MFNIILIYIAAYVIINLAVNSITLMAFLRTFSRSWLMVFVLVIAVGLLWA